MLRLNRISSILLGLSMLFVFGCKDSSLVPYDFQTDRVKESLIKKWIFENGIQPGDTSKTNAGWVLDVMKDGSYTSSSPNRSTSKGRWTYNKTDSSITLVPSDGSTSSTFKIDSISDASVVLKNLRDDGGISLRALRGPLFSVKGDLKFEKSITIPKDHKLSVLWKSSGEGDESFFWGQGSIDVISNTFQIDFDSYPPDNLVSKFYGCMGKIGIGSIYLHSDARSNVQGTVITGIPKNTIGIVQDKALVFLFGQFEGTQCSYEFPWVSDFNKGFSIGDAAYGLGEKDKYIPTSNMKCNLVVTDSPESYRIPVWWK